MWTDKFAHQFEAYQGAPLSSEQMIEIQRLALAFDLKDDDITWGVVAALLVCASMLQRAHTTVRADIEEFEKSARRTTAYMEASIKDAGKRIADLELASIDRMEQAAKRLAEPNQHFQREVENKAIEHRTIVQAAIKNATSLLEGLGGNFKKNTDAALHDFLSRMREAESRLDNARNKANERIAVERTEMTRLTNNFKFVIIAWPVSILVALLVGGIIRYEPTNSAGVPTATGMRPPSVMCDPRTGCAYAK